MEREDIAALIEAFARRDHAAFELAEARGAQQRSQDRFERAKANFDEIEHTLKALCARHNVRPGDPQAVVPRFASAYEMARADVRPPHGNR